MIKLKPILEEQRYKLFVDLDGVLTDFDGDFIALTGIKNMKSGTEFENKYGTKEFWSIIDKAGLKFWANMSWMPDAKQLWNFANKNFDTTIMTKPSKKANSIKGKKIWISRELGNVPAIISRGEKGRYAKSNYILIDDTVKNIKSWKKNGGIAIYHRSASDTISKLKKILGMND